MGNCANTHKPAKNKQKGELKVKVGKKDLKNTCAEQKPEQDIFEDMTPARKNKSPAPSSKASKFKPNNAKDSLQKGNTLSQSSSEDMNCEKTTASNLNIKDNYKFCKIIGEGSFGKVRLANNSSGKKFAIKSLLKADADQHYYLLRRELEIMKKVDHPNLVKFYETYQDDKYLHFVMEYVEGVELSAFCERRFSTGRRFTELEVAYIIRKLISAISHMHSLSISHRDLKPENIIINEQNLDIKILDFGLSRDLSNGISNLQSVVGTPLYVAPEVIQEQPYNQKCDVWSLGVLMYYLLSGKQPFQGCSIKDLFQQICSGNFSFRLPVWNDISEEAKTLITQLLTVKVEQRITCERALRSPWFDKLLQRQHNQKSRQIKKCLSKIHNVIAFQNSHRFKQEVIRVLFNTQTKSEDIEKLKMAFETIDYNDNGFISAQEMFNATQELKIPISLNQINSLFLEINSAKNHGNFRRSDELDIKSFDNDETQEEQKKVIDSNQNHIHYSDFMFAAINIAKELDQEKIKQLFQHFDKDKDNYISIEDLNNALAQEGRLLPQQVIKQMIEEVDTDNDNKISYEEFVQIIQVEIETFSKTRTSFTSLEI